MDEITKKECDAWDGKFNGMNAVHGIHNEKSYKVKGTYMDSNGCLKTYSEGYDESFISDTEYDY